MKLNIIIYSILLLGLSLLACNYNPNEKGKELTTAQDSIPKGAVYVKYERGSYPYLEGIINDSIPCSLIWDTGVSDEVIILSDSLKGLYSDSLTVQIGEFRKNLRIIHLSNNDVFNEIGHSAAFIGKDFFKGQVVEVSLSQNYLREVSNLDAVKDEYTKIKIEKFLHLNLPIKLYAQGQEVEAYVFIDTGSPNSFFLSHKLIENREFTFEHIVENEPVFSTGKFKTTYYALKLDSVNLNNCLTVKKEYIATFLKYPNESATIGMLGNAFLDNYVFILDQINYDLYLKSLNN